jgi:tRNA threonylcarbamoyladenosine biosynthesis protein TsaE
MFISNRVEDTVAAGRKEGQAARQGDVFGLCGDLGAGKTQFARGLVAGLGSGADVTSPTFTLLHEYHGGRLPVYHFDFYRLETRDAALRLGLDEYVFGDGVCVIEWANRYPDLLPPETKWFLFELKSGNARLIAEGPRP